MSGRSAKSSKEKKSKSSSTNVVQMPSSSSTSSQPLCDESELERQYQTYKKQFDEWTAKNKGVVSEDAYNNYVKQFKTWEKEIDKRRNLAKSHNNLSDAAPSSAGTANDSNVSGIAPFDPAAMMGMDPYSSMMMMTAMMMMPFMMMGATPTDTAGASVPTVATAEQPAIQKTETVSFSGKPVSYKNVQPKPQTPAPLPGYIPLPDLSKPPPGVPANPAKQIEMDHVRRGQRSNDRYFVDDEPLRHRPPFREPPVDRQSRGTHDDYDDYWYRRCMEGRPRAPEPPPQVWDREPRPVPLFPEGYRPRSPPVNLDRMFRGHGFEPMQRGPEPWNQSGFGANDFSMRRHERRY